MSDSIKTKLIRAYNRKDDVLFDRAIDEIESMLDSCKAEPFTEEKVERMLEKFRGDIPFSFEGRL